MKRNSANILLTAVLSFILLGCAGAKPEASLSRRSQALEGLGNSLIRQGDLRGGLIKLLEANRLDPSNADICNALGLAYRDLRDYGKSLTYFKKALALRREFPECCNNMGTLYILKKEWDLAIECFQKAVDSDFYKTPHFAYNNMGLAHYNKNNLKLAIENYRQALGLSPDYPDCYENLAHVYEVMDNSEKAIEVYESGIAHTPNYPALHLKLGKLYLRLNRNNAAEKELGLTVKINPNGVYGNEAAQLLDAM